MSKEFNNFIKNCKKYKKYIFDLSTEQLSEKNTNFIKTCFENESTGLTLSTSSSIVVYSLEKSYICWSSPSYKEEDHVMFKKCLSQSFKYKLK